MKVNEIISALLLNYLGLAAVVIVAYLAARSRSSFYMRFVSANPSIAEALGAPVAKLLFGAVLLSGALAGAAGFVISSGEEGRLTQTFFQGFGVSGVLIGFLARNNPIAAAILAALMPVLVIAAQNLQVFYSVPGSMVQLIGAVIVMCVATSDFLTQHRLPWSR